MIAKHIPMRITKKSNFKELVDYIADEDERKQSFITNVTVTNCHRSSPHLAVDEIVATQLQNTRAESDKTYHLIISLKAGEQPEPGILQAIEARVCDALGFGEHQRVSAVHTNTDNLHIHVAINKIHPYRFTIHNPYCDHQILGAMCVKLEKEYGLGHDNHKPKQRGAQSRAADMEHASGVESLLGWVRRECVDAMRGASNWKELHTVMQQHGLAISERGNGLVITDGEGRAIKPSSVARDLSKKRLEERLGLFESPGIGPQPIKAYQPRPMGSGHTVELYAQYRAEKVRRAEARQREVQSARQQRKGLIEAAKAEASAKRAAIRLLGGGRLNKRLLYALVHAKLKKKLQTISIRHQEALKEITQGSRQVSWLGWLQDKALHGDMDALAALRTRKMKHQGGGNVFTIEASQKNQLPLQGLQPVAVTKRGSLLYRFGASAVRDDGSRLSVSTDISRKALELSLRMAVQRFGPRIHVNGTEEFKQRVVRLAVEERVEVLFENSALEQLKQTLLSNSNIQEETHERSQSMRTTSRTGRPARRSRVEQRRRGDNGNERIRELPGSGRVHKPNVARIGHCPPPTSQNRLRDLSELNMVHFTQRSEVLLPRDVPDHLEQQQPGPNNRVRRMASEPGQVMNPGETAAARYVAEREEKRAFIKDILKHTCWRKGRTETAHYAGWRQKDGQPLILLRSSSFEIIVVPVDDRTLHRMKRLTHGDEVMLDAQGMIRKRGRSR